MCLVAILKEDPPELEVTERHISPGLARVVEHCLEKEPEQRFHSASDLAFALDALSGSESGAALPATGVSHRRLWPAWAAVATAAAVTLALLPLLRKPPSPVGLPKRLPKPPPAEAGLGQNAESSSTRPTLGGHCGE